MLQHRGAAGSGVAVVKLRVLPWHPTPLLRADPMKLLEAEPPRWVLSGVAPSGVAQHPALQFCGRTQGGSLSPCKASPLPAQGSAPFPCPLPGARNSPAAKPWGSGHGTKLRKVRNRGFQLQERVLGWDKAGSLHAREGDFLQERLAPRGREVNPRGSSSAGTARCWSS